MDLPSKRVGNVYRAHEIVEVLRLEHRETQVVGGLEVRVQVLGGFSSHRSGQELGLLQRRVSRFRSRLAAWQSGLVREQHIWMVSASGLVDGAHRSRKGDTFKEVGASRDLVRYILGGCTTSKRIHVCAHHQGHMSFFTKPRSGPGEGAVRVGERAVLVGGGLGGAKFSSFFFLSLR